MNAPPPRVLRPTPKAFASRQLNAQRPTSNLRKVEKLIRKPWRPGSPRGNPSPRRSPLLFRLISSSFFPSIMAATPSRPLFFEFYFLLFLHRFEFRRAYGCQGQNKEEV